MRMAMLSLYLIMLVLTVEILYLDYYVKRLITRSVNQEKLIVILTTRLDGIDKRVTVNQKAIVYGKE